VLFVGKELSGYEFISEDMPDERARVGRRAFLALGAAAIGGCVESSVPVGRETTRTAATSGESADLTADRETDQTENTVTNQSTTPIGKTIGIDSDRSEPQATATIGDDDLSGDETDTITVWNNAETARRITVAIREQKTAGALLFRETYRFKPDAYVVIGLSNPGKYVVSVAVDGEKPTTTEFTTDDCNVQSWDITVMPNGLVRAIGTSTMMECGMI
jgi:hypothetical protein